jgi:hypothetical protein
MTTPDPMTDEAKRLRAAQELLDERPRPDVRARVLRAAAESAHGHRVDKTTRRAPSERAARRWFEWRPMAAAGATAVAILAVGIALRVERETSNEAPAAPSMSTPQPPAAAPATAASPAAAPAAAPPATEPAVQSPARMQAPAAPRAALRRQAAPVNPDDWLRRIVELRRAGKATQADEELARFRAAFPNVNVPADALK